MNFTPEQIAKAKSAKSVEALLAYAKEIGFALTEDEAKFYFDQWHKEGELSDNELDNVSGGSQCIGGKSYSEDPPYMLIVTAGNTCPKYKFCGIGHPMATDNGTCCWCSSRQGSIPMYCNKRTADNDPYR